MNHRRVVWAVALVAIVMLGTAVPAYAVTSFWVEPEIVVHADAAITPGDMTGRTPDQYEPDGSMKLAQKLPVGAEPVDRVVVAGDEDFFVLKTSDGSGYVRIGSTGPLSISDGTGNSFDNASESGFDGPDGDSDLVETTMWAATELARGRGDALVYMRITTGSKTPVAYRISFVNELPPSRVGGAYGPGVVAEDYIDAVAKGDATDLYRATRVRYTEPQITTLRQRLFGRRSAFKNGLVTHELDPKVDLDAEGELPIQHIILSDEQSDVVKGEWALVVTTQQRDGLSVVTDARPDTSITAAQVDAVIQRDHSISDKMGGAASLAQPLRSRPWLPLALAAGGVVLIMGIGVWSWRARRRRRIE